ncbi:hypothetical protein F5B20DRAFT_596694 [Whalleya microplaca]|nr:hypothetical protein F5B20DRAFT_596694 [Whalleya microplaca]
MEPLQQFHLFPELPLELQLMIWEFHRQNRQRIRHYFGYIPPSDAQFLLDNQEEPPVSSNNDPMTPVLREQPVAQTYGCVDATQPMGKILVNNATPERISQSSIMWLNRQANLHLESIQLNKYRMALYPGYTEASNFWLMDAENYGAENLQCANSFSVTIDVNTDIFVMGTHCPYWYSFDPIWWFITCKGLTQTQDTWISRVQKIAFCISGRPRYPRWSRFFEACPSLRVLYLILQQCDDCEFRISQHLEDTSLLNEDGLLPMDIAKGLWNSWKERDNPRRCKSYCNRVLRDFCLDYVFSNLEQQVEEIEDFARNLGLHVEVKCVLDPY